MNPDDVENAAWHFLCVARGRIAGEARAALLPVGPDARVPMREVYQMFRGALDAGQVLSAAGIEPAGQFYGHLYLGLYFEALGMKGSRAASTSRLPRAIDLPASAATCTWWRACTCARCGQVAGPAALPPKGGNDDRERAEATGS